MLKRVRICIPRGSSRKGGSSAVQATSPARTGGSSRNCSRPASPARGLSPELRSPPQGRERASLILGPARGPCGAKQVGQQDVGLLLAPAVDRVDGAHHQRGGRRCIEWPALGFHQRTRRRRECAGGRPRRLVLVMPPSSRQNPEPSIPQLRDLSVGARSAESKDTTPAG